MSRGFAVLALAVAGTVGLLATSSGGGSTGGAVIMSSAPAAQQAGTSGGGAAVAGQCVPGDGGLPPPGEPRKDSLRNEPLEIPADMLARYQKAGAEYGLPWELLAGIGMSETGHGRNKNTSSAGARGPMQFMPETWASFGVDGDGDGVKDILDPDDAVPGAANYLTASGAPGDVRAALFAYNRATWYVNDVLWYAQSYGARECPTVPAAGGPVAGIGQCPATSHAAENGLRPGALRGLRCGAEAFPQLKAWEGRSPRPNKSDHPMGLAVDAMIPDWQSDAGNAFGWQVARWYVSHAEELGITYIIYDDQTWRARSGEWAAYTHPNGPTQDATLRHLDHVHVSFGG